MIEWSPLQMLRSSGPDEWVMVDAMRTGRIGLVRRIETGPYREAWFRAVTWSADPSRRELVGYSPSMEAIAEALWKRQPPTAQEKPFPGYPPSTQASPR
ncbi:hypothetical protein Q0F99_19885 [Rathayibacter oskolensis]|uniref:hypothetical protein n=1 Tax=Rathayibacter oskolensis TaxID=1891671 RepID=UPI00265E0051|nr:hypothetical protein [Rathayibacter oskolensis]WKK71556.1 hypothetical protein Q0F99_19885 [Rathayibacter oskolensis]